MADSTTSTTTSSPTTSTTPSTPSSTPVNSTSSSSNSTPSTTPATPTASTSNTTSATSPGYIDSGNNRIIVEKNVPFTYKLPTATTASSIVTGWIPDGLHIDVANGVITGIPQTVGRTVFSIFVPENGTSTTYVVDILYALSVNIVSPADPDLAFVPMPVVRNPGDNPALQILGTGGDGKYTYAIIGNSNGLIIDNKGNLTGVLPKTEGTFTLTVSVSDSLTTVNVPLTFTVSNTIPLVYKQQQTDDQYWAWASNEYAKYSIWATNNASVPFSANPQMWTNVYRTVKSMIYKFVENPTVSGVETIAGIVQDILSYGVTNQTDGLVSQLTGTDLIILNTLYFLLGSTGEVNQSVLQIFQKRPAITIPNNWNNITRAIQNTGVKGFFG